MSTLPVGTVPVSTVVTESKTWLQKHTAIIATVLFLATAVFVTQKYFDYKVANDGKASQAIQQQLDEQKIINAQTLTQAQKTLDDYKTALDVYAKQNSALTAAIAARDKGVQQQQATNATLPPSALASRWATLIGAKAGEITAGSSGITVTEDAALTSVNMIEEVPVLTQDLKDKQTEITNLNTEVNKSELLVTQGQTLVDGLQAQLVDQSKACKIQVQTVTDSAKKSRLKWFGAGFVTGFVTGVWAGLHL